MEEEIKKIKKERDEYLEGWKRAKADYLNYKKEEMARAKTMASYVREDFLLDLMPIIDNLERAERGAKETEKDSALSQGLSQIIVQCREFLKQQGLEEIETEGKEFNPEFHEAIEQVEGEDSGQIAEEVEKGYILNGKILRPAKVKVIK